MLTSNTWTVWLRNTGWRWISTRIKRGSTRKKSVTKCVDCRATGPIPGIQVPKKMSKDAWKQFKVKTQPPFGIGRIIKFYQLSSARAHKFPVSRSQFVAAEYWKAGPYARVNRYLRHDYKWLTKCQISADITYWQRQLYLKKPHPNGCCRLLTWIRVQIRLKQCQHQWLVQEKRLWHV